MPGPIPAGRFAAGPDGRSGGPYARSSMDGDSSGGIGGDESAPGRRRWVPVLVAVVAVATVLAPMFGSPASDGFPLSTYPMFARDRGDDLRVDTVVGRDTGGAVVRLSPELISGSDEPVLAAVTVSRALAAGREESLCDEVAARVVDAGRTDVRVVEVVSEHHDLDRFAPDEPLSRRPRARCEVPR